MSDIDNWTQEGGSVEVEQQEEYNYSPALGKAEAQEEPEADEPEAQDAPEESGGTMTIKPSGVMRGAILDPDSGKKFSPNEEVTVSGEEGQRLLELNSQGRPLFVRTDS